ncbi:hypothetical protein L6452_38678 [Arctium lappa]|uniref:Uncharacterized protein n=1 Tax=Arctium lappa TaxID=4217 RepID=A0ACB8XQF0_ARCLA|nr:hypothetical protein L6452_38678 [Arctium lappa]
MGCKRWSLCPLVQSYLLVGVVCRENPLERKKMKRGGDEEKDGWCDGLDRRWSFMDDGGYRGGRSPAMGGAIFLIAGDAPSAFWSDFDNRSAFRRRRASRMTWLSSNTISPSKETEEETSTISDTSESTHPPPFKTDSACCTHR